MIAVDLSKQQALDADPKAIQQINFTVNLQEQEILDSFEFSLFHSLDIFEFAQGSVKVL